MNLYKPRMSACMYSVLLLAVLPAGEASAVTQAQDAPLLLSPALAPLKPGVAPQAIPFTLGNPAGNAAITPGIPAIDGDSRGEFSVSSNGCTAALAGGNSCQLEVSYTPDGSGGLRSAMLTIPDGSGNVLASALLTTTEGKGNEAARRLPDVLTSLSITQNGSPVTTLESGTPATVTWGQTGYQSGVDSVLAVFECNQASLDDKTCGSDFGTNTQHSGFKPSGGSTASAWSYGDVQAKANQYSWTFTPSCQGDALVLRFYQRSTADGAAGNASLSLLIPGGLLADGRYFDQEGRRLRLPCIVPA